jgi:hypothetical protein
VRHCGNREAISKTLVGAFFASTGSAVSTRLFFKHPMPTHDDEQWSGSLALDRWMALELEAEKQFQLDRQQWILAPVAEEESEA